MERTRKWCDAIENYIYFKIAHFLVLLSIFSSRHRSGDAPGGSQQPDHLQLSGVWVQGPRSSLTAIFSARLALIGR